MKLLFITTKFPDFPDDGIKLISFNLIKSLKLKYSYDIDLVIVTFDSGDFDMSIIKEYCSSIKVYNIKSQNVIAKIINLFRLTPNHILKYYNKAVIDAVAETINHGKYDALFAMPIEAGQYIGVKKGGVLRILGTLDAHSLKERRQFNAEPFLAFYKYYSMINYFKDVLYEKYEYSKYDLCSFVSKYDIEYLNKYIGVSNAVYINNGVDTEYFNPDIVEPIDNVQSLIFTGSYLYKPNEDAAIYLANRIFPVLKNRYPDLKLWLVGKNPTNKMIKLCNKNGVCITGHVLDIRPYIKSATVFVSPLRYGSGIKNKVLEAMSMGLPVVCSKISANDMDEAVDEGFLVIADTEEDYVSKIGNLLDNKDLCKKESRDFILRNYRWDIAAGCFNDVIVKRLNDVRKV